MEVLEAQENSDFLTQSLPMCSNHSLLNLQFFCLRIIEKHNLDISKLPKILQKCARNVTFLSNGPPDERLMRFLPKLLHFKTPYVLTGECMSFLGGHTKNYIFTDYVDIKVYTVAENANQAKELVINLIPFFSVKAEITSYRTPSRFSGCLIEIEEDDDYFWSPFEFQFEYMNKTEIQKIKKDPLLLALHNISSLPLEPTRNLHGKFYGFPIQNDLMCISFCRDKKFTFKDELAVQRLTSLCDDAFLHGIPRDRNILNKLAFNEMTPTLEEFLATKSNVELVDFIDDYRHQIERTHFTRTRKTLHYHKEIINLISS